MLHKYYTLVSYKNLTYTIVEVVAENTKEAINQIELYFKNKYGINNNDCRIVELQEVI